MPVRDVEGQNSTIGKLGEIEFYRFSREKVQRDRVGAEGIKNNQAIVPVWRLFQREPRVAKNHIKFGGAILQKIEIPRIAGDAFNGSVNFIEGESLARLAVACHRPGTETNDSDLLLGECPGERRKHLPDGAGTEEIEERLAAAGRVEALRAVDGGSVDEQG